MSEQRPRKPLGSYLRKTGNIQQPRKPLGSYFIQSEPTPSLTPTSVVASSAVTLGIDTVTKQPISVHQNDLWEGTYIVGVQGMGKTSLLEQVIYQQIDNNEAVIVIDPHGDLANSIIAHMPADKLSKTYLLDLKDREYPFGLSLFACSDSEDEEERDTTRNQIMHAFEKLWPETKEGQYFKKILRHVVVTMIENPQLTLANVKRLVQDKNYRKRYTDNLRNSETRAFWKSEYDQLTESKQATETNPLRGRLDELLTEPVIKNILRQTQKTVNIRELIEERGILLVKLPVNEEAYQYSAPVIGTLFMAMIYAAIFSFADTTFTDRPGCTLVVDEFQNFATDEYAKLFEQGRKYKVKQFLAHQHRQQFLRGDTSSTNLAASLSAQTIVAFRTIPSDGRELSTLLQKINSQRQPTNIYIDVTKRLLHHPAEAVKEFASTYVSRLEAGSRLRGKDVTYTYPYRYSWRFKEVVKSDSYFLPYDYHHNPQFDFGAGEVEYPDAQPQKVLDLLNTLLYESEKQGRVVTGKREQVIKEIAPLLRFDGYLAGKPKQAEGEQGRYTAFVAALDALVQTLIARPLAEDSDLSPTAIAGMLEHMPKRHALVKTGSTAFEMETSDTRLLQVSTTASEAAHRLQQVRKQTRERYCVSRRELAELEETTAEADQPETQPEQEETKTASQPPRQRKEPEPEIEMNEQEIYEVPEPVLPLPEPPAQSAPAKQPAVQLPESKDRSNVLYAQLKAKAIDPDTTILAALGDSYVMTIQQWMKLFEWKSYPRATKYFKELREKGLISHKDREGRGGKLVTGDWFFLLNRGANELMKRKQDTPVFSLEPNEAEKTSGDTLFHTYLVNEVLIHLRLLERYHPELIKIEGIDHERSMRRKYLAALGTDTKLYPDGFLRLLVPTANGLKRRYMFLELQHTTQKDKHNWQTKVRKYQDLFSRPDNLERYFSTRAPQVLVLTMDEAYVEYHKAWTEEVLAEGRGRGYSNRLLVGAYDTGISDLTTSPVDFFCSPRFYQPFQDAALSIFDTERK